MQECFVTLLGRDRPKQASRIADEQQRPTRRPSATTAASSQAVEQEQRRKGAARLHGSLGVCIARAKHLKHLIVPRIVAPPYPTQATVIVRQPDVLTILIASKPIRTALHPHAPTGDLRYTSIALEFCGLLPITIPLRVHPHFGPSGNQPDVPKQVSPTARVCRRERQSSCNSVRCGHNLRRIGPPVPMSVSVPHASRAAGVCCNPRYAYARNVT